MRWFLTAAAAAAVALPAQAQQSIAYVPVEGVTVSGSLSVENGRASIGNNGTVTAGESTAHVELARGGALALCASTTIHLSRDNSVQQQESTALMIGLDRGAMEASYTPGKYSDVLLTPDLRILLSGPGTADLKVRVAKNGDTCVDNHGVNAPYVTVDSQFEGGIYRVQPNQRVLFEHGSLQQVVDNEQEPCGCPDKTSLSLAKDRLPALTDEEAARTARKKVGGPSSTPEDVTFPLAVSEGLQPPPAPPTKPVAAPGETHVQVTAPLSYSAAAKQTTPEPPDIAAAPPPAGQPTAFDHSAAPGPQTAPAASQASAEKNGSKSSRSVLGHIGHFFARLFGR